MSKKELKKILRESKGYLKSGAPKLVRLFGCTYADAKAAVKEVSAEGYTPSKKKVKRLFIDIETSPNVMLHWRAGYNMTLGHHTIIKERAIICISYKWENQDKVFNLKWDSKQCDRALLEKIVPIIESADEVIAHNGDGFDIKWMAGRALFHRIPFPAKVRTLDTLKKCRAQFNLNSQKLDYIAKYLGFEGKLPTGFGLWKDLMLTNCPKAMETMLEYCDEDVRLLENVFHVIESYIKPMTHAGVHQGEDKSSCPSCGSTQVEVIKDVVTAGGAIKKQCKCGICSSRFEVSMSTYKKFLSEG